MITSAIATSPITFNLDPSKIAPLNPANVKLTPTPTTTTQQSFLDKILGIGTKVTTFANQATDTFNRVTNTFNPQTPQQPQTNFAQQQNMVAQKQGMSTGAKVAIGVGVAALVGTVVYLATGSKK